jgi:hypothetical protein
MYEKNCLHFGLIARLQQAQHILVLQMHPSSQHEKAQVLEKIFTIDPQVSVHTLHAHTLQTQDDPDIHMLLTAVKGPSCVMACDTYTSFVQLLQLFMTAKTPLPFTVTGAKTMDRMLSPASLDVLAHRTLEWDSLLKIAHPGSYMVGSLSLHASTCVCTPLPEHRPSPCL